MADRIAPLAISLPNLVTDWSKEPSLLFADGHEHPDPKIGISLYGPRSLGTDRHKQEVHVGFIGPGESVERARKFYEECAEGIAGDDKHEPFSGCKSDRGFRCKLRFGDAIIEELAQREIRQILNIKKRRQAFELLLLLLRNKMEILTQKDHPLDYIVLVLPQDLYLKCRSVNYTIREVGSVHRDLRRAFKAMAMGFLKPTQILLDTTTRLTPSARKLDHKSKIAWNLFTGLYFKVDGLPWGPQGLTASTCFVGISFFRPLGSSSTLRTSVVQAFDENGEGLVLRGHDFHWDEKEQNTKSPHLTEDLAADLIKMVLERYQEERKQPPVRVVIYKTSRFEPKEREGFEHELSHVGRYDLVAISPTSDIRLIRSGKYPPLRGAAFALGDFSFLYSNGYSLDLGGFPHGHVPSPLRITDHVGDTPQSQLQKEMLMLTKMNWNSAEAWELMPIPLRFSRLVGDILREVQEGKPQPKYKFYM